MPDNRPVGVAELAELMLERLLAARYEIVGGEWVSADGAAAALDTTPRTLRLYREEHRGPRFYRLGARIVLYSIQDLAEFKANDSLADSASDIRPQRRYVRSRR